MTLSLLSRRWVVVLGLAAAGAAAAAAQAVEPAMTRDEMRTFLQTAPIVAAQPIGRGTTRPMRFTLSDGHVTWDAAFRSIDQRYTDRDVREGRRRAGELRFVDSYKYNIAGYEMAELLGLGHVVTVTVERVWGGGPGGERVTGALAWWVVTMMDEAERRRKGAILPDPADWDRQLQRMVVFGQLIRDHDRNLGNILITHDWRFIMVDFTRAFRLGGSLRLPHTLQRCDRRLLGRLRTLTAVEVRKAVGTQLTVFEINALIARRDRIVERFEERIASRGEDRVLYDEPPGREPS